MKTQEESVTSQVVKNSFWNFLMIFLGRLGGLLFTAIIARLLLPEKYGIYALATSVALLTVSLTNRGTNQTLSKYLAEALGKNRKKKAASYYKFIFKIKLLLTFASAAALFLLSYPLTFLVFRKPDLFIPLLISSAYLICLSFQNFYEYLFYTIEKVKYLTIKEIILQLSKIIFVLLLLTQFPKEDSVSLTVFALIISSLIAIFFMRINLKKKINFVFKTSKEKIEKRKIVGFLENMILSNISSFIFSYIDIIIIGIFMASEYLGYYSAAFTIVGSLYGFIAITGILLPVFTKMKKERLSDAFNKVFRYMSMVSIPIIFGLIVLGRYILRTVYGYNYLQAALPLIFLSFLIFEFPVTDSLKSLFYAKDLPKKVVKISLISLLINIILNIAFISFLLKFSTEIWAITGVAISTLISRFFILTTLSIEARKKLGIKYTLKPIIKPIIAGLIMMLSLFFINLYISEMNIWIGIFEIVFGAFIYFVFMILIKGIKKQDLDLIKILKLKL